MFNKFILSLAPESKKHLILAVLFNVLALLLNIAIFGIFVYALFAFTSGARFNPYLGAITLLGFFLLRFVLVEGVHRETYLATGTMKKKIRALILEKNIVNQKERGKSLSVAEITQLALEGVEQTEHYVSVFLPQFFYALFSVVIVFTVIALISLKTAIVLLLAIPLIPLSVMAIVTFAKRLFSKYWGNYTNLGGDFLDYTNGMTTLKIHAADESVAKKIDTSAEKFRKITMRVLSLQLNSITVMDAIAFGGAALAITFGLRELINGTISVYQMLFISLVAADFFLPLRALGSAFHVALNGITAAKKIETFLSSAPSLPSAEAPLKINKITLKDVHFNYSSEKEILNDFNLTLTKGSFIALVGDSGSGKSTLASILTGYERVTKGQILINDQPISEVNFFALNNAVRRVSFDSRIFNGTIRSNLALAKIEATDEEMMRALAKAELRDFVMTNGGLDYPINEGGQNLSGGQRQRLALARIFLTTADVYIFDEALASIDGTTEALIMDEIVKLTKDAAVLFITHRLEVIKKADLIYLLKDGQFESGTHENLLKAQGQYAKMYDTQRRTLMQKEEGVQ